LFTVSTASACRPAGVIASGSTLYGTTGNGTVFSVDTDGSGFNNFATFGGNPSGVLLLSGGTLYGTEKTGGFYNEGSVFKVNTDGSGLTTLHSFDFAAGEGYHPICGLVLSGTNLYGTTYTGGTLSYYGTVFVVDTNSGVGFKTLYNFGSTGGCSPYSGLVLSGTNLYGTTSDVATSGDGTIFRINTNTTDPVFKTLYSFSGTDGQAPKGDLLLSGNTLCGTTTAGGSGLGGTAFMLNTDGSGFTTLHNFTASIDGSAPLCGMVLDGYSLYGTTSAGVSGSYNDGTIWALDFTPTLSVALSGPEYIYKGYTGFGIPYGGSNWFTITSSYARPTDLQVTFYVGGNGTDDNTNDIGPCYAWPGQDFTVSGADKAPFSCAFYVIIPAGQTQAIIGVQTLDTGSSCDGDQVLLVTIPGDSGVLQYSWYYVNPAEAQATAYIVPD
jgi:uncharacterized repeat protein (TIGR03803 family)